MMISRLVLATACGLGFCGCAGDSGQGEQPETPPASTQVTAPPPDEEAARRSPISVVPKPRLVEPLPVRPPPEGRIVVELPPSPALPDSTVTRRLADGSWTVAGLRAELDARVKEGDAGIQVDVTATVARVYTPPVCPPEILCPPAELPHVWVLDDLRDDDMLQRMMVVGYRVDIPEREAERWEGVPEIVLEQGKTYTFRGVFRQFSDTGFSEALGLLEFRAVRSAGGWVMPRGAPWDLGE